MMTAGERFDRLVNEEMENKEISGANILVSAHGRTLFKRSYGFADIENGVPMREDAIFRLFSLSKVVTGTAALMLLERGMIDPYEPLCEFIPEFADMEYFDENGERHRAERPIQIRDLLSMTSGIAYPGDYSFAEREMAGVYDDITAGQDRGEYTDTVEFARRLAAVPLAFTPGAKWRYGASADICGAVIEIVSGMRFGEFLKKEIFEPLHMDDTDFYVPEEKRARFAQAYRHFDAKAPGSAPTTKSEALNGADRPRLEVLTGKHLGMEGYDRPPHFESGGAGLVSTIGDIHKLAQTLMLGGTSSEGVRLMGKETARLLRTNALTDKQRRYMDWESLIGYGYGNFNRVLLDPGQTVTNAPAGEFGWDGWLGTYLTIDPSNEFIFEYFIQRADSGTTTPTRKLRSIAYGLL